MRKQRPRPPLGFTVRDLAEGRIAPAVKDLKERLQEVVADDDSGPAAAPTGTPSTQR